MLDPVDRIADQGAVSEGARRGTDIAAVQLSAARWLLDS